MTELLADDWSRRTVRIGGEEIPVWPEAQKVSRLEVYGIKVVEQIPYSCLNSSIAIGFVL